MVWLVLIETAGNQDYVFATNKLRENVGASELLHRIGTTFVVEAVAAQKGASYADLANRCGAGQSARLSTEDFVHALDRIGSADPRPLVSDGIEIVVATSGKAVLLVDTPDRGRAIVSAVTERALEQAPGAVVRGFIHAMPGTDRELAGMGVREAHDAVECVHRGIETLRRALPPPEARYPTLPILRPCQSSGLPAVDYRETEPGYAIAAPVRAKERAREAGLLRMRTALGTIGEFLPKRVDDFEDSIDWLAIVHADGNGFGRLFLRFGEIVEHLLPDRLPTARDYFDRYRQFSLSLELCGLAACRVALEKLMQRIEAGSVARSEDVSAAPAAGGAKTKDQRPKLRVLPLVLGGDDLTVACDGRYAVDFAADYLAAFEKATEEKRFGEFESLLPEIADANGPLGAAAGVAIVKPHFPFHRAYDLAEALGKSAKRTKKLLKWTDDKGKERTCDSISTLDFQTIYEDASADLKALRHRWEVDKGKTRLFARPYIVSSPDKASSRDRLKDALEAATDKDVERWARNRRFDDFRASVEALIASEQSNETADGERQGLPRSQQHALREAAFRGEDAGEARFRLIAHRYPGIRWGALCRPPAEAEADKLFFEDQVPDDNRQEDRVPEEETHKKKWKTVRTTVFLDALEYIDVRRPAAADLRPSSEETVPEEELAP